MSFIESEVIAAIAEQAHITGIGLERSMPLADLGLDSLDYVCIVEDLEERLAVRIPESAAPETVGDFIEMLGKLIYDPDYISGELSVRALGGD